MSTPNDSLHKLKRSNAGDGSASHRTPLPKFPWKTRVLLPVAILAALVALLFTAGYDSFAPATAVAVEATEDENGRHVHVRANSNEPSADGESTQLEADLVESREGAEVRREVRVEVQKSRHE